MDKNLKLEDYGISSKYGFIYPDPLVKLPEYFDPWNNIAQNLYQHIQDKNLRSEVDKMPQLDHTRLDGEREQVCAHVLLGHITMAYVWQDGPNGATEVVPKQLAVPFYSICKNLGLPPVLVYRSALLANWTFRDPSGPLDISNIRTIVGFVPDPDWFMIVSWIVEFKFAPAIQEIVSSLEAVRDDNEDRLKKSLQNIKSVIMSMTDALKDFNVKSESAVFFNEIFPFLQGWGNSEFPLPNGVIFEGASDTPIKCDGARAAETSTIQSLDALLGVQHPPEKVVYQNSLRTYMPPKHAQFIEDVKNASTVRQYITRCSDADVKLVYNELLESIEAFRSYHIQLVTKFVVIEARNNQPSDEQSKEIQIPGGIPLVPFLKEFRDTTKEHIL